MAKIIYRTKQKSVLLSYAETLLLLTGEFGVELLDAFFPKKYPETWLTRRLLGLDSLSREKFRATRQRLIERGLVAKRARTYAVTAAGHGMLEKLQRTLNSHAPHWDRKWRLVVFDIPEAKKKYREALRRELVATDFLRLQDSVWIGKHPLPNEVLTFIEECNLGKHVYLFLSSVVDREESVAALFRTQEAALRNTSPADVSNRAP